MLEGPLIRAVFMWWDKREIGELLLPTYSCLTHFSNSNEMVKAIGLEEERSAH